MPLSIVTVDPPVPPSLHLNRLGMANLIGSGQPLAVSDVGCELMLDIHNKQAFRFGTGGDMVDTHTHTHTHRHRHHSPFSSVASFLSTS